MYVCMYIYIYIYYTHTYIFIHYSGEEELSGPLAGLCGASMSRAGEAGPQAHLQYYY